MTKSDGTILDVLSTQTPLELIDTPAVGDKLSSFINEHDREFFEQNCNWVSHKAGARGTVHIQLRKGHEWWIAVNASIENIDKVTLQVTLEYDKSASSVTSAIQLTNVVEASQQGVVVVGHDGPVYVSLGYVKLLGYDSIEDLLATGKVGLLSSIYPDDHEIVLKFAEEALVGDFKETAHVFRLVRKDASTLWVEIISSSMMWDGKPAYVSWFKDITERMKAERAIEKFTSDLNKARLVAERASQAKSEFLAMMSHEIRTPLNGVIGMAEVLKMTELTDKQESMAEVIEGSGRELLGILNNILDLSKLEAGHTEVHEDTTDIEETLAAVLRIMSPATDGLSVPLSVKIEDGVPTAFLCDAGKLQQVLKNFIGNAIKFTSSGEITLGVRMRKGPCGNDFIRFEVRDTGIGISEETIQKLFNRFVQADSSTSRKFGGTGLGLAICKELALLMSGKVGCDSAVGQGSTFWISLPAREKTFETQDQNFAV
jgi:PAS domain S-box-containing protein